MSHTITAPFALVTFAEPELRVYLYDNEPEMTYRKDANSLIVENPLVTFDGAVLSIKATALKYQNRKEKSFIDEYEPEEWEKFHESAIKEDFKLVKKNWYSKRKPETQKTKCVFVWARLKDNYEWSASTTNWFFRDVRTTVAK